MPRNITEVRAESSRLAGVLGLASHREEGAVPTIPFVDLVKNGLSSWSKPNELLRVIESSSWEKEDREPLINHFAAHYLPDLLSAFKLCKTEIGSPWNRALALVLASPYFLKHFKRDLSQLEDFLVFVAKRLVLVDEVELRKFRAVGVDLDEGNSRSVEAVALTFCNTLGIVKGLLDRDEDELVYLVQIFNDLALLFVRFSTPSFISRPTRQIIPEPTLTILRTSCRAWNHWRAHHQTDYITGLGEFDDGERKPKSKSLEMAWDERGGVFQSADCFLESLRKGGRIEPPPRWRTDDRKPLILLPTDSLLLRDTCEVELRDPGTRCKNPYGGVQACAKCKAVVYCWKEHQAADWKRHKLSCYKDLD